MFVCLHVCPSPACLPIHSPNVSFVSLSNNLCTSIVFPCSHTSVWGFLLAHILLLSLRIWWVSLNPVWTDKNVNSLVLVLGLLSVVEFLYSNEELKTTKQQRRESTVAMESSSWPLVGIGAGSLLFLTHWVYSEVSVVFRWAVSGHPDTGLEPNPWG